MSEQRGAKVPRRLRRYLDDLLRGRRPRPFPAQPEEAAQIRTAITLRAARPGSGTPSEEFVTVLRRRLAEELDAPAAALPAGTTSRRRIVRLASAAAATAAVGAAGGAAADHALTAGSRMAAEAEDANLSPNTGTWHTVASSTELVDGAVRSFDVGTVTGFVTRTGGRLSAVSGICSHQSCRLALDGPARELTCPCHNAAFTLTGTVIRHQLRIAPKTLATLTVREVDGAVQVYAP